jgi:hypothetical protein
MTDGEKLTAGEGSAGEGRQAAAKAAPAAAASVGNAPAADAARKRRSRKRTGGVAERRAEAAAPVRSYTPPERLTEAQHYQLPNTAMEALAVFQSLDNRRKESFLVRAGILALSYRRRTGVGRDDYIVTFPVITLAARALVENVARYTAGMQRLFDEAKNGTLTPTAQMSKLMAQQAVLWETTSPHRLVDILEAAEFEAAYLSTPERLRAGSRDFKGYKPFGGASDGDDLEALVEHYKTYRREAPRRDRYEYRRYVPAPAPLRPGTDVSAAPGQTAPGRTPNASRPTSAAASGNTVTRAARGPARPERTSNASRLTTAAATGDAGAQTSGSPAKRRRIRNRSRSAAAPAASEPPVALVAPVASSTPAAVSGNVAAPALPPPAPAGFNLFA